VDPLPPSWSVLESPVGPPEAAGAGAAPEPAPDAERALRGRLAILAAIAVAGVGGIVLAAAVAVSAGGAQRSVVLPSVAGSARPGGATSGTIVVEVVGAVRKPGLVHLPANSRVADAIAAAGGFSPAVDTAAASAGLHLAKPVADGDQVRVPARGDAAAAASTGPGASARNAGGPIDLNTATEAELDSLPGVGPATVAKIVAARTERPFTSVDELRDRKIVGAATLAKIHDLVVVR
jgi:competence protein ComEA